MQHVTNTQCNIERILYCVCTTYIFVVHGLNNHNTNDMVLFTLIVSPCTADLCLNNGTCTVTSDGNANCTCDGDWTGNMCDGKYSKTN